jgi:hypothetical protein
LRRLAAPLFFSTMRNILGGVAVLSLGLAGCGGAPPDKAPAPKGACTLPAHVEGDPWLAADEPPADCPTVKVSDDDPHGAFDGASH